MAMKDKTKQEEVKDGLAQNKLDNQKEKTNSKKKGKGERVVSFARSTLKTVEKL